MEKVTQYCSTQSKLGGKVFLGLAMAYEAEGKTGKAIGLYTALTKSPIEQIKMNADTPLCGLEAMNSMRNEVKLKDFSIEHLALLVRVDSDASRSKYESMVKCWKWRGELKGGMAWDTEMEQVKVNNAYASVLLQNRPRLL